MDLVSNVYLEANVVFFDEYAGTGEAGTLEIRFCAREFKYSRWPIWADILTWDNRAFSQFLDSIDKGIESKFTFDVVGSYDNIKTDTWYYSNSKMTVSIWDYGTLYTTIQIDLIESLKRELEGLRNLIDETQTNKQCMEQMRYERKSF